MIIIIGSIGQICHVSKVNHLLHLIDPNTCQGSNFIMSQFTNEFYSSRVPQFQLQWPKSTPSPFSKARSVPWCCQSNYKNTQSSTLNPLRNMRGINLPVRELSLKRYSNTTIDLISATSNTSLKVFPIFLVKFNPPT